MSTFLELAQDLSSETGISGGSGPATVVGQTGDNALVVDFIRAAELYIQNLHVDWPWLWAEHSDSLVATDRTVGLPASPIVVRQWDRDSFYLDRNANDWIKLEHIPWQDWKTFYDTGVISTAAPSSYTIKPDGVIQLNTKCDQAYTFSGEYWAQPTAMTVADATVSSIPADYHRLILVRAQIIYANREDAREVLVGAAAEYEDLLEKLENAVLPGRDTMGMSEGDQYLTIETQ